jgi:hypothetical protein
MVEVRNSIGNHSTKKEKKREERKNTYQSINSSLAFSPSSFCEYYFLHFRWITLTRGLKHASRGK